MNTTFYNPDFFNLNNIIMSIKSTAPISIVLNITIAIVLLIVSICLRKIENPSKNQLIASKSCMVICIIAFIGVIANIYTIIFM